MMWQKIQQEIFKTIDIILRERLKDLSFCYCVDGTIVQKNVDNTYNVKINDAISENIKAIHNQNYEVGDVVEVLIINNNYSNKKILDKKY